MTITPVRRRQPFGVLSTSNKNDNNVTTLKEQDRAAKPKQAQKLEPTRDTQTAFKKLCNLRVPEDAEGDLKEHGIYEWSTSDFVYVRTLGTGGQGTVFLAREKVSGHEIALKVVLEDEEEAFAEVLIHEKMQSPSIVEMIDYFVSDASFGPHEAQEEKCLFIILEYCSGGCLFDIILEDGPIEEEQASVFFKSALEAVSHVHEQNCIHCDIKALNFIVDGNKLKLIDFGMAVESDDKEIIGGSPVYMSPEHLVAWKHMTTHFDYRIDAYSLGVMLYEMLAGHLPYKVLRKEDKQEPQDGLDSLTETFNTLDLSSDDLSACFTRPVLDLRDIQSVSALQVPQPEFPDNMLSEEAKDLVLKLMEQDFEKRISIKDALNHKWFLRN